MCFNVICSVIENDIRHDIGQILLWTHEAHIILTNVMTKIDNSKDNAEPHLICYIDKCVKNYKRRQVTSGES